MFVLSRSVEHYRKNLNNGLTHFSNDSTQRKNDDRQCKYHFIMRKSYGLQDLYSRGHPEMIFNGKFSVSSAALLIYLKLHGFH